MKADVIVTLFTTHARVNLPLGANGSGQQDERSINEAVSEIRQFGWHNRATIGADEYAPAARQRRGKVDLIPQKTDGLQARHCLAALRTSDGTFERVDGVTLLQGHCSRRCLRKRRRGWLRPVRF